jgi:quercetin dioxygenase-like cupin family protein
MQMSLVFLLGALVALALTAFAWDVRVSHEHSAGSETVSRVLSRADTPFRKAPSGKARIGLLGQGHNAFLGELHLAAGAKVPSHRDATEEYIHVLKGSGMVYIEGKAHPVGPGSTIVMAADAEVRFENGTEDLVGIQVFAGPAPALKYGSWLEE